MKVWAANEDMLKYLKHPITKVGFIDMNTPANWPNDSFTYRRIRDGDVLVDQPEKQTEEPQPEPVSETVPEPPPSESSSS